MLQIIFGINNKIFTILLLSLLFVDFAFSEHNMTYDGTYQMAREAYEKGHEETSIKYLLLAESLGSDDAYVNLCWICNHDRDNNLTKQWCNVNNCLQEQ